MALSEIFIFCSNHSGMGFRLAIQDQEPPVPQIDLCNCGSLDFPASGNLVINEIKHKLLHSQVAYVGEEQKFTTGIDRISTSETYANSLTLDFSKYPVYVSHSTRFVVRTLEHDIIALKYVGVDDTLLKIENPIKFNNINNGVDLHNKTILLDVESICDYEGNVSCCDKMPTSLFIRDSINTLEVIYDPSEAVTTTTTTTTFPPPLPPTNLQHIVAPYTQWAIEPDPRFKSIGSSTNNLYYDVDTYNDFYNVLFGLPVGGVFTPAYNFIEYITARPLKPDPITGQYTTWEDKEVDPSHLEIQFWDSQADAWSSTYGRKSFYFTNLPDFLKFDSNNDLLSCDSTPDACPYFILRGENGRFNSFNPSTKTFDYYTSISAPRTRTIMVIRPAFMGNKADFANVYQIAKIHKISYRSRVIINGVPSDWAVNNTSVTIFSYELLWKQLA